MVNESRRSSEPLVDAAFPTHPGEITAAWLSAVLHDRVGMTSARVESVEIAAASTQKSIIGEVVRLTLNYDRADSDAPRSLIAKFPTPHQERRAYFVSLGMYSREVHFYQVLAEHIALRTPRCYFARWDAEQARGILLLEDLAPAQPGNRIAGCSIAQAEQVVHEISRLHIDWWDSPKLSQYDLLGTLDLAFFHARYCQSWHALQPRLNEQLPQPVLKLGQQLAEHEDILKPLWELPLTLIHRDLQLDNIFFVDEQPPIVVDWQLIMPGCGVFDVANFLCWNLEPALRREHETRILRDYHDGLIAGGISNYSWQQCVADYHLSLAECFARVIAVLGQNLVENQTLQASLDILLSRTSSALVDLEVNLLS